MATKHNPDPNNPTSKEGKRMALELKHEHMLAEATKAAEERKRARSVGDTLQSPKRGCRPWQAEREAWRATPRLSYSHAPPTEGFQSASVEVLHTEPSAQHTFGKPVILITINGRYDLHLPPYVCQTCQQQWTPDLTVLRVDTGQLRTTGAHSACYGMDQDSLHQALSTRYVKTSERLLEETASLELKTELHCVSDDMVST
ncbi:hypothetical protein KUCAC02_024852 [Chaenocephalus aceratus]|nr:hypothetical protein KUCAC02_024852 [Chaenocephalus aceratus]